MSEDDRAFATRLARYCARNPVALERLTYDGSMKAVTYRDDKTINDPAYWLGSMTPRATGRMLEDIQRCNDGATPAVASKAACADMLRMFRAQQSGARRLPHFVSMPVGHKTGDFPPVLANDVGIIYARSGPIVVSFFLNGIRGPYGEAEDRIGRVAQLIVQYFDGVAPARQVAFELARISHQGLA